MHPQVGESSVARETPSTLPRADSARAAVGLPYNGSVKILMSAGEASGEMYGAQLMEALRTRVGSGDALVRAGSEDRQLQFFGAGGERMRAAGCDIVVDAKDLAVVGITEIVSHLPKILGLYKKLIRSADEQQ